MMPNPLTAFTATHRIPSPCGAPVAESDGFAV